MQIIKTKTDLYNVEVKHRRVSAFQNIRFFDVIAERPKSATENSEPIKSD